MVDPYFTSTIECPIDRSMDEAVTYFLSYDLRPQETEGDGP